MARPINVRAEAPVEKVEWASQSERDDLPGLSDLATGEGPNAAREAAGLKKAWPTPGEWAKDVFDAAAELGYGVEYMAYGRVRIANGRTAIEVESVLLSGEYLRKILRDARS